MANNYTTTDVENIKKRATELGMNLDPNISSQLQLELPTGLFTFIKQKSILAFIHRTMWFN